MSKRLVFTLGLMAVIAATGAVGVVLMATRSPREVVWSSMSTAPVPEDFLEVWFPKPGVRSFADEALTTDPGLWTRPLLNKRAEMASPAVGCIDPGGIRRYIASGDLAPLPAPGQSLAMNEVVQALKGRTAGPPIVSIAYSLKADSEPAQVVLVVRDERGREDTYEYAVVQGRVTSREWSRRFRW